MVKPPRKTLALRTVLFIYAGVLLTLLSVATIFMWKTPPQPQVPYNQQSTTASIEPPSVTAEIAPPTSPITPEIQGKLANLEADVKILRSTDSAVRIHNIENSLKELREALSTDPTRALTLQRITVEQASMTSRVESLQSQMQWIFGISMTLALGVLATVVSVVKSSFEKPTETKDTGK